MHDAVRDAVADLGVGLRRLGPARRTLEDVYMGAGRERRAGRTLFDLGYRPYDGTRSAPAWAILTVWRLTMQRVLGLGRGARHKVLPAITLVIAFLPALIFVAVAAFRRSTRSSTTCSRTASTFFIGSALALFAALVAPEALCPDRRTGMLGLYLAGPLDRNRYLAASGRRSRRHAPDHRRPAALHARRVVVRAGPSVGETPQLLLRILAAGIAMALLYAALAMAVSSFTTRRAAAAVAVVLVLLVPSIAVGVAIESSGAPDALDLFSLPFVAAELAYRIFGEPAAPTTMRRSPTSRRARRRWACRLDRARGGRLLVPLPAQGGAA